MIKQSFIVIVSLLIISIASYLYSDEHENAEITTVTFTEKVLVKDTVRFGINLGGDAYYSGAALLKKRSTQNFEGASFRQCHFGPGADAEGSSTWFSS